MENWTFSDDDMAQIGQFTRDRVGISTLERYTGSDQADFQPYILLTNFKRYADEFAEQYGQPLRQGTVMRACHVPEERLSIVDFGVGSPVAALIMELLSFVEPKAALMLGMCGGLSRYHQVGDFFNPIAAIREEGTSNAYLPPQCPALPVFDVQRAVTRELEDRNFKYHNGVIHTTNVRFWEFNEEFKAMLKRERVQTIDMECATLFTVGFARNVPVGALMLISDLPLKEGGVKTKESAMALFRTHTEAHIEVGVAVLKRIQQREADGYVCTY